MGTETADEKRIKELAIIIHTAADELEAIAYMAELKRNTKGA